MSKTEERVLWGKHPAHGALWLKLCANPSKKEKKSRENDGWELAELYAGEHPDTGKRLPLYPCRKVKA